MKEFEVKKDCFGYYTEKGEGKCNALDGLYCRCEDCAFYKTKEKFLKDFGSFYTREQAIKLLRYTPNTLRTKVSSGEIREISVGKKVLIPSIYVDKLAKKRGLSFNVV